MYDQTMMSVTCNVPLPNGYMCGIQTIAGRCSRCQRAFCASHQVYGQTYFGELIPTGICTVCRDEEQKRKAEEGWRRQQEQEEFIKRDPQAYFDSGLAVMELVAADVPRDALFEVQERVKRKWFGDKEYMVAEPIGSGWVLGTFTWMVEEPEHPLRTEYHQHAEKKLAFLLKRNIDKPNRIYGALGLVPVRPYADEVYRGYVRVDTGIYNERLNVWRGKLVYRFSDGVSYKEEVERAMQAVKKLLGK
jgi:hypothetical protein